MGGNPVSGSALLAGATPQAISSKLLLPAPQAIVKRATASYANDTFGPHIMTGVNNTHAAGQLGSGVLVRWRLLIRRARPDDSINRSACSTLVRYSRRCIVNMAGTLT